MRPRLNEFLTYKYLWGYLRDKKEDYVLTEEDFAFFVELGYTMINEIKKTIKQ